MDLAQIKAAVTMEGVLSSTAALELIAEVERLTALCDGYRGERDALKAKCEDRRNMLEDVVNELDLSDGMIEQHGPMGTAPATLVRLVLERKDREIAMLKAGIVPIGDEFALTRARAEAEEFEKAKAHISGDRLGSYTRCGEWTLTAALTTEEIGNSHYRAALKQGRAEGMEEAAGAMELAAVQIETRINTIAADFAASNLRAVAAAIRARVSDAP